MKEIAVAVPNRYDVDLEGWGMVEGRGHRTPGADAAKRALDIALGLVAAMLALPVMVLSAVGSAIALRAFPFFTQQRVGRDGRTFCVVKIRTLPVDVPPYVDKHQLDLAEVPAFCRLLRQLHLDELPQLFLVVIGRMSLVGPRPEMPHLHEGMPEDFRRLRTSVRPGCTGLWQVSSSCTDLISVSPEYDRFYLANRSLRLDLWVLAQTTLKMIGFARPLTLQALPSWVASAEASAVLSATAPAPRTP